MTNIRRLVTAHADLDDLTAGAHLSRLESLAFKYCSGGVPVVLKAASQLRHLSFRRYGCCEDMTAADVAVLSSLPALATLVLQDSRREKEAQWAERLAQLRADFHAQDRASLSVVGVRWGWSEDYEEDGDEDGSEDGDEDSSEDDDVNGGQDEDCCEDEDDDEEGTWRQRRQRLWWW